MTGEERALAETLHSLLAELIAIPSATPPGDTRAICEAGAEHLKAAGYEVSMPMRTAPIANLVARLGEGSPCVVFNAHIDTVGTGDRAAWRTDPFAATMEKGRIYGLGANNCKGSAAVHLWLAGEVARLGGPARGSLVFVLAGDEERLGPEGTAFLREEGIIEPMRWCSARPPKIRSSSRNAASSGSRSKPPAAPLTAAIRRQATTPSSA